MLAEWKSREFIKLLKANGYEYVRSKGDHAIYSNGSNHIAITKPTIKGVIVQRLIKENNLKEDI